MPCRQLPTRHTSSWWPRPQASSWTPVTQPDHPSRRLQRGHTGRLLREARLKVWHNTRELHQARLVGPDRYAVRLAELGYSISIGPRYVPPPPPPPPPSVVHADSAQGAVLARLNERGRHGRPQLGSPLELQLGDGRFTAAAGVGRILLLWRRLGASSACRVSRPRQLRHEHRRGLGVCLRRGPDQPQGARRHPGEGQQPAQSRTHDLRRPLDRLRQRSGCLHAVVRVRPLVRHARQLRRTWRS